MAEAIDIRALNEQIERQSAFVTNLMTGMDQVIVGQKHLVESLLIGLLSDGHILLEGVPGLAKNISNQDSCIIDRCQVQPNPVYSGLTSSRRYRYHDL